MPTSGENFSGRWLINSSEHPAPFSKFDPYQSGACWRTCGEQSADHLHVFWRCPALNEFWKEIFDSIDKIFNCWMERGLLLAILGAVQEEVMSKKNIYLLLLLITSHCSQEVNNP